LNHLGAPITDRVPERILLDMGCGDSKIEMTRYYTEKEENDYLKIGITHRELEKFAAVFRKFDVDGGAELSL
jgi:hypothetical protein